MSVVSLDSEDTEEEEEEEIEEDISVLLPSMMIMTLLLFSAGVPSKERKIIVKTTSLLCSPFMVCRLLRVTVLFLSVGLRGVNARLWRALMSERLEREELLLFRLYLWPRRPKLDKTSFFSCTTLSDCRIELA